MKFYRTLRKNIICVERRPWNIERQLCIKKSAIFMLKMEFKVSEERFKIICCKNSYYPYIHTYIDSSSLFHYELKQF